MSLDEGCRGEVCLEECERLELRHEKDISDRGMHVSPVKVIPPVREPFPLYHKEALLRVTSTSREQGRKEERGGNEKEGGGEGQSRNRALFSVIGK